MKNSKVLYFLIAFFLFFMVVDLNDLSYSTISNIEELEEYDGVNKVIIINNNVPFFTDEDKVLTSFEQYSELDYLKRCGTAFANVSIDTMPTEERKSIGQIKPSGWHTIKYDFIDQLYLYNRCHLIAFSLTGENDNEKNLITCTRQMNANIMTEYENKVANYVRKTKNHVLYRVTPIFEKDNLIATGVEIEALSVEDNGNGISFNVFIYNVQDRIKIDYKTGDSKVID